MPNEEPPTAEGVIAEVNSHMKFTLSACFQVMSLSVSERKRHVRPKSLPAMKSHASAMQMMTRESKCTDFHTSTLNSLWKSHAMTQSPMITGRITRQRLKSLEPGLD